MFHFFLFREDACRDKTRPKPNNLSRSTGGDPVGGSFLFGYRSGVFAILLAGNSSSWK
jgi:hypothetical protein